MKIKLATGERLVNLRLSLVHPGMLFAEMAGRSSRFTFKKPAEMGRIIKAQVKGNFFKTKLTVQQQALGFQ